MDDKIHTSQQKAGEHSKPEGQGVTGSESIYGTEGAPTGVPTSKGIANPFDTTANIHGQLSKPEGD